MSKKGTKALASAALMSLVLTTALSAGPVKAASSTVTRTSGADRYATAAQVAKSNWTTTDNVVLVSGEGYADSVSASALAKKLDAPILLTTSDTLSSDAESAIKQLKPKNIYVIGGNASVSQSIRNNLKTDYNLVELGGANRYETNVAVAEKLVELGVSASDVLVVGGEGFSDALSVAPVAAAKGQILLLANNNESSIKSVVDFVKDNSSKVTVVGTKNVINDAIYNALGASTRVDGGKDRFETNLNVLNKFEDTFKKDKLYVANASAATPDNLYADALVASALAGKYTAPLVLVDKDTSSTEALDYIAEAGKDTALDVNVIGGTGVISDALYGKIEDALKIKPNPNNDSEVKSVSAVNLNQIKVVFSDEVDEDTAEEVANYKVDGTALVEQEKDESGNLKHTSNDIDREAKAVLQDDNKTVLITLAKPRKQSDDVDITVKKGILSADKSSSVDEYNQSVTFSDTTTPTIESVKVRGNSKITVKFSEPLNLKNINSLKSKFKVDGQSISSMGLDTDSSEIKDPVLGNNDEIWSDEVDFYFSTKLESGNRTLKISDGDDKSGSETGLLSDAAGFPFKESTEDFNVDDVTGAPKINSIKAEDNGKVYINFDRPMDEKTATKLGNYKINGDLVSDESGAKIELKEEDTQVKISGVSGLLNKNSNTLYVDDAVKDAYGNKVEEDTNESFELEEDDTKPTIESVKVLDDDVIRVRFSKDVNAMEATDKSNYKIKDNSGTDVSETMEDITIPGKSGEPDDNDSTDVVDINFDSDLTESTYTITIENITDTTSSENEMDKYEETIDGAKDIKPEVDAVTTGASDQKLVVQFSREMDPNSITELSNYKYRNGNGDLKDLPSDTDIDASNDNKSAIIEFPSNYTVRKDATKNSGYGDNDVIEIDVLTGAEDANGNPLEISVAKAITEAANVTTVKPNSLKVYYNENDDDELDVSFKCTKSIDEFEAKDFTFNGVTPDTGKRDGDLLVLIYNTDSSKEAVKKGGVNAKLVVKDGNTTKTTTDVSGKPIAVETDSAGNAIAGTITPYSYQAAPKIISEPEDVWTATVSDTKAEVNIVFDTPIYKNSIDEDDFTFRVGTTVDADDVKIDENDNRTVTFIFNKSESVAKFKAEKDKNGSVKILAKNDKAKNICTEEDRDGEKAYFAPDDDDYPIEITIDAGDDEPEPGEVAATIEEAGTAILGKTIVVASLPDDVDATKYDVTINGTKLTYDSSAKKFTVTLDGTYTKAELQDLVQVTEKQQTELPEATVEQAGTAILGKTIVVASLPSTVDATKYNVTINGTDLTYDSSTKKFTATLDGTYTVSELQGLVEVAEK
ncbi:cell wall-binding repeat-containing protein [Clostridium sp.]|uniref:cell wall-binding repeat-containing protein n=1 Tax=Clostridium sp. TaxID=1506 RepID=UPI0035A1504C